MRIYEYNSADSAALTGGRVIALGFFDGVHAGHRSLLKAAKERSERDNVPFAVFTFRSEAADMKAGTRLYSTSQKLSLIEDCGADEVVLADFESMRGLTAEEFVRDFLIAECGCTVAVTGRDFRFGSGAAGSTEMLTRIMRETGRDVIIVDDVTRLGKKVSTTAIKALLTDGDAESAALMLSLPYFIEAIVEHGRGVGRTLGFPTLNCNMAENVGILRHGVYLSTAEIGGVRYPALTNVGVCPTFEERTEHAETYLLDFDGELYGEHVKIYLLKFMREERRFSSASELTEQISSDIERAKKEFCDKWQEIGLR